MEEDISKSWKDKTYNMKKLLISTSNTEQEN